MSCINVCLERKGKGGCGIKEVLGIYLVETTRRKSVRVKQVLVCGPLWLNGNCWYCLCGNLLEMGPLGKGGRCVGSKGRNLTAKELS